MIRSAWKKFHFVLFILIGLFIILFGWLYYASPITRLQLYGVKLDHRVALSGPANFLMGWQSKFESWTERGGRLDTPLLNETSEEVSTLRLDRLKGSRTENVILVQPQEWIRSHKNAAGFQNQTISVNHPSILPGKIVLDKQGTLLERRPVDAWRIGRALQFLCPKFPKGTQRFGNTWSEHLEWTDVLGEWKILWQADLHWALKGFDTRYENPCALLVYEAALDPTVLEGPAWAKITPRGARFTGEARGDAVYNVKDKFLISNTFTYAGSLKVHVPSLDSVPDDVRVGLATSASDGDVVLKIDNKVDIRQP